MNVEGTPAEVTMTVQITRAATGLTETYELKGRVTLPPEPQPDPQHPFQPQLFDFQEK